MKRRDFLLATAFALAGTPVFAQSGDRPIDIVRKLYDPKAVKPEGVYSARLQEMFDADERLAEKEGIGHLDFDWLSGGQEDPLITDLTVETVSASGGRATVRARFKNYDEPRERIFRFVREKGAWRIDEVSLTPEATTLSKILRGE